MKNAALLVTSEGGYVLVVVDGEDRAVTLTMTPADAREIAAKLLTEAHAIDVDADLDSLLVRQVGEA